MRLKELYSRLVDNHIQLDINHIITTYNNNGYECWIVGGPVRDLLMEIIPHDIDFATNCPLEITKSLFKSVIPTGEDHGTLTIHINGENYEVTRYREDVATDGRRATIKYAETIEEDVMRRDFTVNAMAFNPLTNELVDIVGGMNDFNNKILRFVGNTKDRILEDHLRFLRMLRFAVRLGFKLDLETIKDAKESFNFDTLSKERVYDELMKICKLDLTGQDIEFLISASNNVLGLDYLFYRSETSNKVFKDIIKLKSLYPVVYYNGWRPEFKLSTYLRKISNLLIEINAIKDLEKNDIKRLLNKSKKDFDIVSEVLRLHSYYNKSDISKSMDMISYIKEHNEPILITDLKIDGDDLIHLGKHGKEIGMILSRCLRVVYDNPELNTKKELIRYINN